MNIARLMEPYRIQFEAELKNYVDVLGPKSKLRDACEYALINGGKRFRPVLVLLIADVLNRGLSVTKAAIATELFHTASLIADDLPCMDNDDERRDKPSVHKVFGESTALLASYALISAGYACLVESGMNFESSHHFHSKETEKVGFLAIENACFNTGLKGATGGQFEDLHRSSRNLEELLAVLEKKTVTLFEISFVLGWLFGGGPLAQLDLIKKCAFHFGMAFQIADDLNDMKQDAASGRVINIANAFGRNKALALLQEHQSKLKDLLIQLDLYEGLLGALVQFNP